MNIEAGKIQMRMVWERPELVRMDAADAENLPGTTGADRMVGSGPIAS